jgi:signal transduction histidine kinase
VSERRKPPKPLPEQEGPPTSRFPQRQSGAYSKIDPSIASDGRKLAGAVHDLRNLLFVISSCSQAAVTETAPGSELFDGLTDIGIAAARALRLVDSIAAGVRPARVASSIDVNEVITDFLSILRRQGGARVRVIFEPDPEPLHANMDPHALEHVLLNLVVNAVDAIAVAGEVTITTARGAASVRVTVADTGRGMDAITLERAFEPRFTTKTAIGRSGLGLATVKDLIEDAGGRVTARSTLGSGSEIVVELPASRLEIGFDA